MSDISSWNTTASSNNDSPPDGWPEGQAPSTVNNCAREMMAAVKRYYDDIGGATTSGGSSNAYTLAASQTISAYAAGQWFAFVANHDNTGSATLDVDSVGVKDIKKRHNQPLEAGDIRSDQLVIVYYQAADDIFEMVNPRIAGDSPNIITNGDMRVAQQGTSFTSVTTPANNDDTYTLDQVIVLSNGNDIVDVTQESDGGIDGGSKYVQLDIESGPQKFGILMPIENKDCLDVIGGTVSLSLDAKVSNSSKLTDIRAAVLTWSGTADSITSDVVDAWNGDGTNPTFATNWTAYRREPGSNDILGAL